MQLDSMHLPKLGLDKNIAHIHQALTNFIEGNLANLPNGKYTLIENKLIAIISTYNTLQEDNAVWESHKKFIDVQYMIHGSELFGCTGIKNLAISKKYSSENDCLFYKGDGPLFVLNEGMFVVFYPNNAHKPGIQINESKTVKKLILKIDKQAFQFDPEIVTDFLMVK